MELKAVRNCVLSFQTSANMFEGEDLGNGGGNLEQQLQQEQLKMEHIAQVPSAEYILSSMRTSSFFSHSCTS